MLRKIFLSPFFVPVVIILLWSAVVCGVYFGADNVLRMTKDGEFIDVFAKMGYLLLILLLAFFHQDFQDKILSWGIYVFLTLLCFFRESGVQHFLSITGKTPFKWRFFTRPENPLYEKIIFGALFFLVLGAVIYLAYKYALQLIKSFFKLDTITWGVAFLCTLGVITKYIDRFPSHYRKTHGGVRISEQMYGIMQLIEEAGEMFLPYIGMLILLQHHFLLGRGYEKAQPLS